MNRVAVVLNPAKQVDAAQVREIVKQQTADAGGAPPLWSATRPESPGTQQAQAAVEAGASAVIVGGGDGTVRAAATGLAGTRVPMVLLPLGTGNLLARNLDMPARADLAERIRPAFSGRDQQIDVGWLRLHRAADASDATEHLLLVIAGVGFGAEIVAHTDEDVKRRGGWLADVVAGAKNWRGQRTRVLIGIDEQEPVRRRQRTVLVGNCGKIMGGLTLLRDAVIDDGGLDITVLDPRGGVFGWTRLFGEVVRQGWRRRFSWPPDRTIDHERGRRVRIVSPTLQQVQIDGDVIGSAHGFTARVDPGALTVRLPAS